MPGANLPELTRRNYEHPTRCIRISSSSNRRRSRCPLRIKGSTPAGAWKCNYVILDREEDLSRLYEESRVLLRFNFVEMFHSQYLLYYIDFNVEIHFCNKRFIRSRIYTRLHRNRISATYSASFISTTAIVKYIPEKWCVSPHRKHLTIYFPRWH